ncbi:MAG: helix-turn-helix domain-containing protein [Monoglobus pectinilyticus]
MFQIQLKKFREHLGLSQEELANIIGVRQSTVGMWENGSNKPRHSTLLKLAEALKVSVDELTGDKSQTSSLDEQLKDIDFALQGEVHDLTDAEKQDILDYIKFKKMQRGDI